MKYSLKKIITLTAALILCMPFSFATADVPTDDELFDYIFYVEFINNKPQVSTDAKIPYYIIPVTEHTSVLSSGEFRGEIISGKGKLLESFWFNAPQTTITALGKSRIDLRAPYFANADHVSFYSAKGTKPLFTISLKASSFCNDNNKCEKDVGENYLNCSNDCPAPQKIELPTINTLPTSTGAEPEVLAPIETPEIVTTPPSNTNTEDVAPITTPKENSKNKIIQLTIGIFLILLSVIGFITWKRMHRQHSI